MLTVGIIYIPLCFYFIAEPPPHRTDRGAIYIPLCFYFIPASGCMFAFQGIFTFHYASTLSFFSVIIICKVLDLHSTMLLLYRYYLIPLYHHYLHLHSTMLLLYLADRPGGRPDRDPIYIPLCFYFIEDRAGTAG